MTEPALAETTDFFRVDASSKLDAEKRTTLGQYMTPAPLKYPPTIWKGRALFGSGDGYVYALEAATGRLLWRFRAAPVERHLYAYYH